DAREEAVHEAAGKDCNRDERGRTRRGGSGVDGSERVHAGVADRTAAPSGERVAVTDQGTGPLDDVAFGVRLPDLKDGVGDGVAGAVVDRALEADAAGAARSEEFVVLIKGKRVAVEGAYGLARCGCQLGHVLTPRPRRRRLLRSLSRPAWSQSG